MNLSPSHDLTQDGLLSAFLTLAESAQCLVSVCADTDTHLINPILYLFLQ